MWDPVSVCYIARGALDIRELPSGGPGHDSDRLSRYRGGTIREQEHKQRQIYEKSSPITSSQKPNSTEAQTTRSVQKAIWNSNGSITVLETMPVKSRTSVSSNGKEYCPGQENNQTRLLTRQNDDQSPQLACERSPSDQQYSGSYGGKFKERYLSKCREELASKNSETGSYQTNGRWPREIIASRTREKQQDEIKTSRCVAGMERIILNNKAKSEQDSLIRLPGKTWDSSRSQISDRQDKEELSDFNRDTVHPDSNSFAESLARIANFNFGQSSERNRKLNSPETYMREHKKSELDLNEQKPASYSNKHTTSESYHIIRNFALQGKKVINLGDSLQQIKRFSQIMRISPKYLRL